MKRQWNGGNGGRGFRRRFRWIAVALMGLLPWAVSVYGDTWAGADAASDNWSSDLNWLDGSAPAPADTAGFNLSDTGNVNVVDLDFTVTHLWYWRNGVHITDLNGDRHLQVNGPVEVGSGGSGDGATVTWRNGGSVTIGDSANPRVFQVAYNGSPASGTNVSSLSVIGATVDAWVNNFSIGQNDSSGSADGRLILGNNTLLHIEGITPTPTNVMVLGHNGSGATGSATGLLDARQGSADLHMNELDVGYNKNTSGGSATGTLQWNQTNPIDARYVYFGRGTNATGILEVPSGGTLQFGTPADPIYTLMAAWNTGSGTASATLDFSGTDPTFKVYADGGVVAGINDSTGTADGKLILGDNSRVYAGTAATPTSSSVTIGSNRNGSNGAATGTFDASHGVAEMHVYELLVGDNKSGDPTALGTATGTFTTGEHTVLTADKVQIARGPGTTGTVNLNGGLFAATELNLNTPGATFNYNDGRLAVYTFKTYGSTGTLAQHGGTLAPGFDVNNRGLTALADTLFIDGNYLLDTAGKLEIELFGPADTQYDRLRVSGNVNLDADGKGGGALDLVLNFGPTVGDLFTILDKQSAGAITGQFAGLPESGTLSESYSDYLYAFEISYLGGTGNDVTLKLLNKVWSGGPVMIPAPSALLLGAFGAGLLPWLRRRRLL